MEPSIELIKVLFPMDTEKAMGIYGVAFPPIPYLSWLVSGVSQIGDPGYVHLVVESLCLSMGAADPVLLRRAGVMVGAGPGISRAPIVEI